ncbi:MAG: glycosyltransferase family 87 protein [Aulosira sp. ZfuVER01]|nr:glycosyltransferase family 87 protein [Aulosira sp. ZfuVER01]MDZ8002986.1 glycosyltransferase family 87 protein [Aulosira sp. DedVER01a]MDZ8053499.1 glycosyltransferase family 87 protein [Aulosira sp. ZfuCHP01]
MISLGFWNLIIVIFVTFVLKSNWRLDDEKTTWQNSLFLQNLFIQKLVKFCRQPIVNFIVQAVIVLVVTRLLIYTGWLFYLLNQPNPPLWDFKWFYVASKLSHQHLSPFNLEVFNEGFCTLTKVCSSIPPFVYPPNIIPLIWFLGYFPINNAFTIWTVMHVVAIGLVLWGANILLESRSPALRTVCTIAVALIFGLIFDLQAGNVATFIAVLLLWMLIFARKQQDIPAGTLLGIAVFKPTLAILFIPYFLLKRRFLLVFTCIVMATFLAIIGLALTGNSLAGFLQDAARGVPLWLNDPSNNPYISISRIDLTVVGPRFFPKNTFLAKFLSDSIVLLLFGLVGWYWYKQQLRTAWSKNLYLPEIVLIFCLSIAMSYSQPTSSVMLVPAVVFLLNDLLFQIRYKAFSWKRISVWLVGIGCLLMHTVFIHGWLISSLANHWQWKAGQLPYILKVTIFALPSYAILGITLSILVLSMTYLDREQLPEFDSGNQVSG